MANGITVTEGSEVAFGGFGALDELNVAEDGESTVAVRMAEAELNQHIATARRWPRSLSKVKQRIDALVGLDRETAEECVYALPRAGKTIKGPSVRFAEIVASQYGNCHVGSRVVAVDRLDKVVISEGVFWDLESGMKRTAQVRRRISNNRGEIFNDDMIVVAGNAAASIAMREAVLKGVPKALWRQAYELAEKVKIGDIRTLTETRDAAVAALGTFGVNPEAIFAFLEIGGWDDIDMDHVAALRQAYRDIKSGDATVDALFPNLSKGTRRAPAPKAEGEGEGAAPATSKAKGADKAPTGPRKAAEPPQGAAEGEGAPVVEDEPQPAQDQPQGAAEPAQGGQDAPPAGDAPQGDLLGASEPARKLTAKRRRELQAAIDTFLADAADSSLEAAREANPGLEELIAAEGDDAMRTELAAELAAFEGQEGGEA